MRKLSLVLALAFMVTGAGLALAQGPLTLQMKAQTGSGPGWSSEGSQTGTAVLTAVGTQTKVELNLNAGPAGVGVAQPAHIHAGTCANVGEVKYPLTDVVNGKSTTTVNVTLESLEKGTFAVNAHKSLAQIEVYTSCAEIKAAAAAALPATGDSQLPVLGGLLFLVGVAIIGLGYGLRRRSQA